MELFPVLPRFPGAGDPSFSRWLALATAHQDTDPALDAAVKAWRLTHDPLARGADQSAGQAAARRATQDVCRLVVHAAPEASAPLAEADVLAAREGRGDLPVSLWILAIVRNRTANMHAAEPLLAEAGALAQANGDRRLSLATMMEESTTWTMLGQWVRAADNLRVALDLARTAGERSTEATLLLRLGNLHGQRSEPEPHALYSRAALHIFRSLEDTRQTSEALFNLGWALARQGRHAEAEDCYEQGLPIALDLRWKQGEALFLALRAVLLFDARRDAERERQRSSELLAANTELRAALQREHQLRQVVDLLANTAPLTGLANRRHILEFLAQEVERARRQWQPMALVLLDLDHFKSVNDCHGHGVGDEVLVRLATLLKDSTRSIDLVGRWGGEEFCLALVNTEGEPAFCMTDRVRSAVQAHPFETHSGPLSITVSLGIADLRPDETSLDDLFRRADAALYEAKRHGRNRVAGGPEHAAVLVEA